MGSMMGRTTESEFIGSATTPTAPANSMFPILRKD